MARYAINQEGVEALKKLANGLLISANVLVDAGSVCERTIRNLGDSLGLYEDSILEILAANQNALNNSKEDIVNLAVMISQKAEEVSELVQMLLGDPDVGSSSNGSNNISAGAFGELSSRSAKNNEIAVEMMVNGFARQADFGNLDNKTAQDINTSVSETLNMFPNIDLRFVGSVQSRNQHIKKSLEEMYLDAYRQHYPTASDAELMPFVQQQVAEDMRRLEPSDGTIAQSLFIAEPQNYVEEIIANYNGISINEHYGSDYNYFTNVRQSNVDAKWKPEGCNTPRATVDHELGHQIAKLTNAHNDYEIQEMYARFMCLTSTQRGEILSGYAGDSIHEFIAEGWSEYRNNPNCRPLAMSIANRLFDLYNQHAPRLVKVRR